MPAGQEVVAIGADLAPGTLLDAYRVGMFPMPSDPLTPGSDVAWFSPDPRGIIPLDGLKVTKSLRRSLRRFEVRFDTALSEVVTRCSDPNRNGYWITAEIADAYKTLADLGWAHSVETYLDGQLVGGLYGVRINGLFAGESMFHQATDASKVALVALVEHLNSTGASLLDTQWATDHLATLGAIEVPRDDYLDLLEAAIGARPR